MSRSLSRFETRKRCHDPFHEPRLEPFLRLALLTGRVSVFPVVDGQALALEPRLEPFLRLAVIMDVS